LTKSTESSIIRTAEAALKDLNSSTSPTLNRAKADLEDAINAAKAAIQAGKRALNNALAALKTAETTLKSAKTVAKAAEAQREKYLKYLDYDATQNGFYLTLIKHNHSQYFGGGYYSNSVTVTTKWQKIRIDACTLKVNTGDYTYSTGSTNINSIYGENLFGDGYPYTQMPFGEASSCQGYGDSSASARVDLIGTLFAVNDSWTKIGFVPGGGAIQSANGQVINITGGGNCGLTLPSSAPTNWYLGSGGGYFIQLKYIGN